MCLGIPGRTAEIWDGPSGARMAQVELPTGTGEIETRRLCIASLPDLPIGEYRIAHAGFAQTRIDEEPAMVTIATPVDHGVIGGVPG